jgi:uncharacterized protein (TIRG00374 family)
MKNVEKKIVWSVVFGLVVFAVFTTFGDLNAIRNDLRNFPWLLIIPLLLLSLGNYFFRILRWNYYLKSIGIKISPVKSSLVFRSGFTMGLTPGKLGEVFKSYLLKRSDGIEVSRTLPVVVAERVMDLFSLLVIVSFGLLLFDYGKVSILIIWAILGIAVFLISQEKIVYFIINQLKRVKFLAKKTNFLVKSYDSVKILFHPKKIAVGISYGVIAWSMECLILFLTIRGFGSNISLSAAFFIYAFSMLIGAIAMLPGGLGATEGSMTGLLIMISKVSKNIAIVSTMLVRLATLWFALIIGLFALSAFTNREKINTEDFANAQPKGQKASLAE